jgi:hypothetical protein
MVAKRIMRLATEHIEPCIIAVPQYANFKN